MPCSQKEKKKKNKKREEERKFLELNKNENTTYEPKSIFKKTEGIYRYVWLKFLHFPWSGTIVPLNRLQKNIRMYTVISRATIKKIMQIDITKEAEKIKIQL